jgi:hypothetical protein
LKEINSIFKFFNSEIGTIFCCMQIIWLFVSFVRWRITCFQIEIK